jgi:hypothetical protein
LQEEKLAVDLVSTKGLKKTIEAAVAEAERS